MAGPARRKIGGKVVYIPGAYSSVQYVPNEVGVGESKQLYLVGEALAGKPLTPHALTSTQQARTILQGGPLLEHVLNAMAASPLGNPGVVYAYNIANLTPAQAQIKIAADTVLTVESSFYGPLANMLSLEISGSGDAVTVKYGALSQGFTGIKSDLFQVSSTATGAVFEVATTKAIYTDDNGTNEFAFESFPTVGDLAAALQQLPDVSVLILGSTAQASAELDTLAQVSIATPATITANFYALVEALRDIDYIESVTVAPALASIAEPPDQIIAFTGGSKGLATTGTDWANAFDGLLAYDVGLLVPCTTEPTILATASSSAVTAAASDKRRERLVYCGGKTTESVSGAVATAKSFLSEKTIYCHAPGGIKTGNVLNPAAPPKLYDSSHFAAKIAALISSQPDNFVATNKAINALDFGKRLGPLDREALLRGGVTAGVYNEDNLRIVERAITTTQSGKLAKEEEVTQRSLHTILKDLRKSTSKALVGMPSTAARTSIAQGVFDTRFRKWRDELGIARFFDNLIITEEGDHVHLSFALAVITGTNYVLIDVNVTV